MPPSLQERITSEFKQVRGRINKKGAGMQKENRNEENKEVDRKERDLLRLKDVVSRRQKRHPARACGRGLRFIRIISGCCRTEIRL